MIGLRGFFHSSGVRAAGAFGALGLCVSGCATAPTYTAQTHYHGHEHFAEGKYGKASPRMIEDGQAVPRGGGQYLVGRPYHINGHMYYPNEDEHYAAVGMASWYGDAFHGRKTANGEVYDKMALSAASPTLPLPSYVRVSNLGNGYSVIVRVNDRGPYAAGRVMDVSSRVADVLDFKRMGTAHVRVEYVGRAPLEGSDDDELLATLRTDGGPANLGGGVMVAESASPLLGLFGVGAQAPESPPPPPPPEPPVREIAAAPEPPPSPPRAEAAPAGQDATQDDSDAVPEAPRRDSKPAPLPPPRPRGLGLAREAALAHEPPAKRDRALYFVDPRPSRADPLARLLRRADAHPLTAIDDER